MAHSTGLLDLCKIRTILPESEENVSHHPFRPQPRHLCSRVVQHGGQYFISMFTEERRMSPARHRRLRQFEWRAGEPYLSSAGMRNSPQHIARQDLRVGKDLVDS